MKKALIEKDVRRTETNSSWDSPGMTVRYGVARASCTVYAENQGLRRLRAPNDRILRREILKRVITNPMAAKPFLGPTASLRVTAAFGNRPRRGPADIQTWPYVGDGGP